MAAVQIIDTSNAPLAERDQSVDRQFVAEKGRALQKARPAFTQREIDQANRPGRKDRHESESDRDRHATSGLR